MSEPAPDLPRLSVLVVEDHDLLRKLLPKALPHECDVYTASTVKEGWALYLDYDPNIVFLDIHLPDGNGHDLAGKIKERNPAAFIVMTTSSDREGDIEKAERNRVAGFLSKPFDKSKITGYVEQYLTLCRRQLV